MAGDRNQALQGTDKFDDLLLHSGLDVIYVEILEDDTIFTTVQMQTKNGTTLQFGVDAQIAGTGTAPNFSNNAADPHPKGELIAMSNIQRVTAIRLGAGSCRVVNRR